MTTRLDTAALDVIRKRLKEALPDVIAIYQYGSTVQGEKSTPKATSISPFWHRLPFPIWIGGSYRRIWPRRSIET